MAEKRDPQASSHELHHFTTSYQIAARTLAFEELLAGAREGNNAYIGELQRRFGPALLAAIRHVAADKAQEVVDDTFMALPRKLAGYVDDGRFDKWLYVVAYNIARSANRSTHRRREEPVGEMPVDAGRDASAIARVEEGEIMAYAMRVLPDSEREAWLLHFQGYEPADIGQMLGISANSAAVRVHRAKKKLQKFIASDDEG